MKTFKQILSESHMAAYRGVKMFPTDHAKQRELERHVPKSSLLDIHKKVVDKLKSGEYTPKTGKSFLVFDKERKQTVAFDYRPDKYNKKDTRNHLFLVTAYPHHAEGKPRHDQDKIVTEIDMNRYKLIEASNSGYSEEFLGYVANVLSNREEFSTPYVSVYEQKFEIVDGMLMVKIGESEQFDMEILEV